MCFSPLFICFSLLFFFFFIYFFFFLWIISVAACRTGLKFPFQLQFYSGAAASKMSCETRENTLWALCGYSVFAVNCICVCAAEEKKTQKHSADQVWQRTWNKSTLQFIISFAVWHYFFPRTHSIRAIFGIFSFELITRCQDDQGLEGRRWGKSLNDHQRRGENSSMWKRCPKWLLQPAADSAVALAAMNTLIYCVSQRLAHLNTVEWTVWRKTRNLKIIQTINNRKFIYDADTHTHKSHTTRQQQKNEQRTCCIRFSVFFFFVLVCLVELFPVTDFDFFPVV